MNKEYSLIGIDGNAFSIMGYVQRAMKEVNLKETEMQKYRNDAMSSDYNNLLRISQIAIEKCNDALNIKGVEA